MSRSLVRVLVVAAGVALVASAADAQVLAGAWADELAVKLMAPGRDVLHLGTHGFFPGEG